VATRSGNSWTELGKYDRNRRARAKPSASLSTSSSIVPFFAWIELPPSSSFVRVCPMRATTGGPAANSCEVPRTISE